MGTLLPVLTGRVKPQFTGNVTYTRFLAQHVFKSFFWPGRLVPLYSHWLKSTGGSWLCNGDEEMDEVHSPLAVPYIDFA